MQKLSEFVAQFLFEQGLRHVFMLTGGGAMHLNDAFGRHPELEKIYNHHEQASAMAADSYARISPFIPIVNVTTGPGGINTLNGVFGSWVDSLPMFVVSGQVKFETTVDSTDIPLRQLGDQECRIVEMVKGITKYAVMVTDPKDIKYHLQKALFLTQHGRPGPVWLDIPMNVQGSFIDPDTLRSFDPEKEALLESVPQIDSAQLSTIYEILRTAKRPVILAGAGVHVSGTHEDFLQLIETLNIPTTCGWNTYDIIHNDHPCYAGRPGSLGDRAGNFTVQNADVLLVLGSRLNIRQISYNWTSFARHAHIIIVDIDKAELQKPTLNPDLAVHADLAAFIPQLLAHAKARSFPDKSEWLSWCRERVEKYPVVLDDYWHLKDKVNPYCFMQRLSEHLHEGQIVVSGDGTACVVAFQAMILKAKQRLFTNSGCASMGYDLPGAIGACVATGHQDIVCLAGDGSIMQNIQELATIAFNRYPIKIFVLNNNGYHSIRQTQQNFFGQPLIGVGPDSGLGFPSFEKLAAGFGLPYVGCHNHTELTASIEKTLTHTGPMFCEVFLDLEQVFAPKLSSRRLEDGQMVTSPLEDMAPFLSREELADNMLVTEEACV
ncbi:MAG: thiamine pyrophosphate-binding protein [Gammaproteobacteria bacterium]|nr:thiamine pyrophosphate-binding protein [Gammaproteobacteria bacterium]